jgi:surface protein
MIRLFWYKSFDDDISAWDVSGVIDMTQMFGGASIFNHPISGWDVSSVTGMREMFGGTSLFNQPISGWDVSSVTNMSYMFKSSAFVQDISSWDVSSVTNMRYMFQQATEFDENLCAWGCKVPSGDFANMFTSSGCPTPYDNTPTPDGTSWCHACTAADCAPETPVRQLASKIEAKQLLL